MITAYLAWYVTLMSAYVLCLFIQARSSKLAGGKYDEIPWSMAEHIYQMEHVEYEIKGKLVGHNYQISSDTTKNLYAAAIGDTGKLIVPFLAPIALPEVTALDIAGMEEEELQVYFRLAKAYSKLYRPDTDTLRELAESELVDESVRTAM